MLPIHISRKFRKSDRVLFVKEIVVTRVCVGRIGGKKPIFLDDKERYEEVPTQNGREINRFIAVSSAEAAEAGI